MLGKKFFAVCVFFCVIFFVLFLCFFSSENTPLLPFTKREMEGFLSSFVSSCGMGLSFCVTAQAAGSDDNKSEADKKEVLATVNDEAITLEDYYYSLGHISPEHISPVLEKRDEKRNEDPGQIKRYLDKAIEQKLLVQEALKLNTRE